MYIAPVFTGLEYAAFELFGVGVRQARLVSELTGFASVLFLAWGVGRLGGRDAAVGAGALLATNYVYVMYDRAAIMEASMVAFMVASWYCYVRAQNGREMGLARRRRRAARILHQGVRGVLRRCHRLRGARDVAQRVGAGDAGGAAGRGSLPLPRSLSAA